MVKDLFQIVFCIALSTIIMYLGNTIYFANIDFRTWPEPTGTIHWVQFLAFNILYNLLMSLFNRSLKKQQSPTLTNE